MAFGILIKKNVINGECSASYDRKKIMMGTIKVGSVSSAELGKFGQCRDDTMWWYTIKLNCTLSQIYLGYNRRMKISQKTNIQGGEV